MPVMLADDYNFIAQRLKQLECKIVDEIYWCEYCKLKLPESETSHWEGSPEIVYHSATTCRSRVFAICDTCKNTGWVAGNGVWCHCPDCDNPIGLDYP